MDASRIARMASDCKFPLKRLMEMIARPIAKPPAFGMGR